MPEGRADYHVNAWLRARGNFARQMKRQAAAVAGLSKEIDTAGVRAQAMGRRIMGTTAATTAGWAKMTAVIGGVAAAGGMAAITASGLAFNRVMENTRLQVTTMFQMFDFGADAAKVITGETSQWEYNMAQASGAMQQLYDIAKKSPASYRQVISVYQNAAAGLSTQTENLADHMRFMEKVSLLGGLTFGDYQVLGAQMGRIMAGSAGAEMNVWKVLQKPILEAGQELGSFNKQMQIGGKLTEQFNQLTGRQRLDIMLKAMDKLPPDLAEAFGDSMAGIVSTTQSNLETVSGAFTKPMYEGFRQFLIRMRDSELFGEAGMARWELAGTVVGTLLARTADRVYMAMANGAGFLRDNWEEMTQGAYDMWRTGAAMIKAAFAFGLTRMALGATLIAAGGAARGGAAAVRGARKGVEFFGPRMRAARAAATVGFGRAQMGFGRNRRGPLAFFAQFMGKLAAVGGQGKLSRVILFFTKLGAIAGVIAPLAMGAVLLTGALGGVAVAMAGIGAYLLSKWDEISSGVRAALREGTVTLEPLIYAATLFWEKLKAVGATLLGASGPAETFTTIVGFATVAINALSGAIGIGISALAGMLRVFGFFKAVILGLTQIAMGFIRVGNMVGAVSDDAMARAEANFAQMAENAAKPFLKAQELDAIAERVANITGKDLDLDAVKAKAQAMNKALADALDPSKKKDKVKRPTGPKVAIKHLEIHQDLRDTDPDRLMSAFIKPIERLADQRVQAWDMLEEGI